MNFDINQTKFPSEKHKEIWRCGVAVMPEELSLSDKVKALMDADLFESCRQMRLFMLHSLSDIYENAEKYDTNPQKYLGFWFDLIGIVNHSGDLCDECIIIHFEKWGKGNIKLGKKKWNKYFVNRMDKCYEDIFNNTGIKIKLNEESVEIKNSIYPNIFHAMHEMFNYTRIKKEKNDENSFFYCDFRKICPEYKYDKFESRIPMREIKAKITLLLSDNAKSNALNFVAYLLEKGIKLKWTGVRNNWSESGGTNGLKKGICLISIGECKADWYISVTLKNLDKYKTLIMDDELQNIILNNQYLCNKYIGNYCGGNCDPGITINLLGKDIENVCKLRNADCVSVYVHNPTETEINSIKKLLELEQKARNEKQFNL